MIGHVLGSLIRFGCDELKANPKPKVAPMAAYEIIRAYASPGSKVLPIARSVTRKTGRFRTKEEVNGKIEARLPSLTRFLNQLSDGPYASEKMSAVGISQPMVAPVKREPARAPARAKPQNNVKRPTSQERIDMS